MPAPLRLRRTSASELLPRSKPKVAERPLRAGDYPLGSTSFQCRFCGNVFACAAASRKDTG